MCICPVTSLLYQHSTTVYSTISPRAQNIKARSLLIASLNNTDIQRLCDCVRIYARGLQHSATLSHGPWLTHLSIALSLTYGVLFELHIRIAFRSHLGRQLGILPLKPWKQQQRLVNRGVRSWHPTTTATC